MVFLVDMIITQYGEPSVAVVLKQKVEGFERK